MGENVRESGRHSNVYLSVSSYLLISIPSVKLLMDMSGGKPLDISGDVIEIY